MFERNDTSAADIDSCNENPSIANIGFFKSADNSIAAILQRFVRSSHPFPLIFDQLTKNTLEQNKFKGFHSKTFGRPFKTVRKAEWKRDGKDASGHHRKTCANFSRYRRFQSFCALFVLIKL